MILNNIPNIYHNKKNDIYIEINNRQSGKTHRLVENLVEYIIRTGKDVGLITHNNKTKNLIINIIHRYTTNNNIDIDIKKIKHLSHFNQYFSKNLKLYIDEFDFIQGLKNDFYMRNELYLSSSENPDLNNGNISSIFKSFTHWKRQIIIDKLLNEN